MSFWSMSTIFVSLSCVSVTLASFAIQPAVVHPSRPNTCFNKETKSFFEDGESWQVAGCAMASCMQIRQPSGKSKMMISFDSCGSEGFEPPCYLEEDKEAEFPDCCPQVVCPDSSEQDSKPEEYVDNEVATFSSKNDTSKPYNLENYEDSLRIKERKWRQANNGLDLQLLGSPEEDDVSSEYQNFQKEKQDLFKRKVSPKFFDWY